MSLYQEQDEVVNRTIKTFVRSYLVTVDSPNNLDPQITYLEEKIQRETGQQDISLGPVNEDNPLTETLTTGNAGTSFDLLNPVDGTSLGSTATYADLQVMLYSLFFHLATERDNP